jgi:hypothetical protein
LQLTCLLRRDDDALRHASPDSHPGVALDRHDQRSARVALHHAQLAAVVEAQFGQTAAQCAPALDADQPQAVVARGDAEWERSGGAVCAIPVSARGG